MTKPEDIPQDIWDKAFEAMPAYVQKSYEQSPFAMVLHLGIAKAIASERDRCAHVAFSAYERKTEQCSKILRRIRSGKEVLCVDL